MFKINFSKKKFHKLLLSINRVIESFFNSLNFLKNKKKEKHILKTIQNRVLLAIASFVILILSYFSLPGLYDKDSVKSKLENQIKNKYNLEVSFVDNVSYRLFPKPHFFASNLNIVHNGNIIINSNHTKIYVSMKNFFSFDKLNVHNLFLKKNEINIKKENLSFFKNILNFNKSIHNIVFKDSIVFYKNNFDDVIFLINLENLKFFYDLEDGNQLNAKYDIFNLPFNFI